MDVSTVSPSLISPTEGDDPCEIDVTDVAVHTVTLLIGLCGLPGNGAVLCLLRKKTKARSIFYLAVMDFLFLLLMLPSALLFLVEDVSCSPVMSQVYVSFLSVLSALSYSYWRLMFPIMVFLGPAITCLFDQRCCSDLSESLLWIQEFALFCSVLTPIIAIFMVILLCPAYEQERCQAAVTSMYALLLLITAPVFIFVIIKFIKAKCGSQQQQPKRIDIIIFLAALFALLLSLWNSVQQFGSIIASSQVDFLLACITSSIKPFIYFLVGRCWSPCSMESLRLSLQRVFEEPEETTSHSNDDITDTVI